MYIFPGILSAARSGSNGITWSTGTIGAFRYEGATYANLTNGKFFAVGSNNGSATTTYKYSTDGTSWSDGTLPTSVLWSDIAASSTRLVIGNSSNSNNYYSDNGTTWTATTTGASNATKRMKYVNSLFWRLSNNTTSPNYTSPDGVTWTARSFNNTGITAKSDVSFDGADKYIVVTETTAARSGTAAFVWSTLTLPVSVSAIEYGNGIWVGIGAGSSSYCTSPDGVTWTTRTLPKTTNTNSATRMTFVDGRFYYTGMTVSDDDSLYSSTDGINWTLGHSFSITGFGAAHGWASSPSQLLVFGSRNTTTTGYLKGTK